MRVKSVVSAVSALFLATTFVSAETPVETVFPSIAAHDGWILESSEGSGTGGVLDATSTGGKGLRVGDHSRGRQLVSLVSFDTSPLPDCAEMVSARLELTRNGNSGANPFKSLGDMLVDVHPGVIGSNANLQGGDFEADVDYQEAAATGDQGGNLHVFKIDLDPDMLNVEGLTQMRLRFEKKHNGNNRADYVGFYGAESASNHRNPKLVVSFLCECNVDTDPEPDPEPEPDPDPPVDSN